MTDRASTSGDEPAAAHRAHDTPAPGAAQERRAAKIPAAQLVGQISAGTGGRPVPPRSPNPIVPPRTVARRTLLALVAIMSFLACLSVAAVSVVADRAEGWKRQIADEVTIQIKPTDGMDVEGVVAARRRHRHAGSRRHRGDGDRGIGIARRCWSPGSARISTSRSCPSRASSPSASTRTPTSLQLGRQLARRNPDGQPRQPRAVAAAALLDGAR